MSSRTCWPSQNIGFAYMRDNNIIENPPVVRSSACLSKAPAQPGCCYYHRPRCSIGSRTLVCPAWWRVRCSPALNCHPLISITALSAGMRSACFSDWDTDGSACLATNLTTRGKSRAAAAFSRAFRPMRRTAHRPLSAVTATTRNPCAGPLIACSIAMIRSPESWCAGPMPTSPLPLKFYIAACGFPPTFR